MDFTNEDLQDGIRDFKDGEKIDWQLLKLFFHQHHGFSRRTEDDEHGIGFALNGREFVVYIMEISETDDGTLRAEKMMEPFRIGLVPTTVEKLKSMVNIADRVAPKTEGVDDPDNKDGMYG